MQKKSHKRINSAIAHLTRFCWNGDKTHRIKKKSNNVSAHLPLCCSQQTWTFRSAAPPLEWFLKQENSSHYLRCTFRPLRSLDWTFFALIGGTNYNYREKYNNVSCTLNVNCFMWTLRSLEVYKRSYLIEEMFKIPHETALSEQESINSSAMFGIIYFTLYFIKSC